VSSFLTALQHNVGYLVPLSLTAEKVGYSIFTVNVSNKRALLGLNMNDDVIWYEKVDEKRK